jgi:DNA repair exonuclease SbcCD ATPase subunit
MRIVSLEVENFKPFRKVRIPPGDGRMPEGLFLILGPNSMGKTSLVQSILWALMGEDVIGISNRRRLVRRRQPGCKVDLTFEIGGETYRVVRRLTLKKTRKKSTDEFDSEADLSQLVGTKFIPVKSGAPKVNKEVEKLLSITPENMSNTVFIRQKEVDTLATAEPTYLREMITKLFGLDEFETVKDRLSGRSIGLQGQIDDLGPKVGRLDSEREELGNRITEKNTKKGQLNVLSDEVGREKTTLDGLPNEQLLDDLETNQDEIHDTEEKIRNIQAQIDAVQPSFVQIRERIAAVNLAIEKLDLDKKMVEAEIEKIPPQEAVDQLSKKLSTIETTEKQLGSLWKKNAKKLTLEFEPTKEPEKVKPVLERASVDLAIARQDNQALHQEIERVTILASARGASKEFYEKSLVQIQEASKCPICRGELLDKASIEERINGEARSSETDEKELEVKVKALRTEYDSRETRITGFLDQISVLESMDSICEEYLGVLGEVAEALRSMGFEDVTGLLAAQDVGTVEDLRRKVSSLHQTLSGFPALIDREKTIISEEIARMKALIGEKTNKEAAISELEIAKGKLTGTTRELIGTFNVQTIEEFLSRFEAEDISSLKVRRKELETGVREKSRSHKGLKLEVEGLEKDIESRNGRIAKLEKDERELRERENELRHVKFLKGEVDGFISGYIIERKLFGSLKAVASQYLQNFTGGRYTIEQLIPTTRRVRDREAHGLEITLNDNLDGIVKEREDLSGGDETALGLALRLAISRLMARIRPYKTSQQRPPLVTSLIMDEPLASLDGPRRQMVMTTLFADKAFKQIFLITHTEVQQEGAHVITLTQESKDVRNVECSFGSA